jgi:cell division protein FtsI (penicillin-binding protein 3)
VNNRIIREAEADHEFGILSMNEVLAYSSNVGTAKLAFLLGEDRLRGMLAEFGFGQRTHVDFMGETTGVLHSESWNKHLLANISFGQGVAVTALQIANAYAAIANGGVLHKPYIIQSIRDTESGALKEFQAQEVRRVLTPEESASMRIMLSGVTAPGGTGVNANVEGYMVAGKTGTAQKADSNGRGYLPGAYISSFAGFVPATDPKFVIFVMVDHPTENSYYGSQVAAPIFSRLASYAVRRAGIAPVLLKDKSKDKKIHLPLATQKIEKKKIILIVCRIMNDELLPWQRKK